MSNAIWLAEKRISQLFSHSLKWWGAPLPTPKTCCTMAIKPRLLQPWCVQKNIPLFSLPKSPHIYTNPPPPFQNFCATKSPHLDQFLPKQTRHPIVFNQKNPPFTPFCTTHTHTQPGYAKVCRHPRARCACFCTEVRSISDKGCADAVRPHQWIPARETL